MVAVQITGQCQTGGDSGVPGGYRLSRLMNVFSGHGERLVVFMLPTPLMQAFPLRQLYGAQLISASTDGLPGQAREHPRANCLRWRCPRCS
ncbi:uncharacterized protein [Typha angustifolia]|uniref:uncharacterized protein isoform X2 n=1 Tax=Typha angustifolia TaxID=59011 RepID=UPI003C2C1EBC